MTRIRSPTDRRPESAAARGLGRPIPAIHVAEEIAIRLQGKGPTPVAAAVTGFATARLFAAEGGRPFRPTIPSRND